MRRWPRRKGRRQRCSLSRIHPVFSQEPLLPKSRSSSSPFSRQIRRRCSPSLLLLLLFPPALLSSVGVLEIPLPECVPSPLLTQMPEIHPARGRRRRRSPPPPLPPVVVLPLRRSEQDHVFVTSVDLLPPFSPVSPDVMLSFMRNYGKVWQPAREREQEG